MIDEIGYKIDFDSLFTDLELGHILIEPKCVEGGFLHKSFEVVSDKGHYFVKALNPNIMSRPTALSNFIFSDKVSKIAEKSGVRVASALKIQGNTIHSLSGQYYQVYNWIEGEPSKPSNHNPNKLKACKEIGHILGKIHQIDFTSIYGENMENNGISFIDWNCILEDSRDENMLALIKNEMDIDFIRMIEDVSCRAISKLCDLIVSHRDLDPKNVICAKDGLMVIDWEAAGYVNAMHELSEVALYWSMHMDGAINHKAFEEVLKGYESTKEIDYEELTLALDAVNYNKIGWIEYNLKRALGIESNSQEECVKGYQQVIDTVKLIHKYEEQKDCLKNMLKQHKLCHGTCM